MLKIFLSFILFVCLFEMPYGYFQFVSFTAMVGLGYLAFKASGNNRSQKIWIYSGLAIVF
jgi:hypothetical protein